MTILIVHASTEGQTRKIARRAAAHLTTRGRAVTLTAVTDAARVDPAKFEAAILLASVHAGRYQPEFVAFVTGQRARLAAIPTAFLSVSLSAASKEREDLEGIAAVVKRMTEETGWTPDVVEHVAGALQFSRYGFLKSWAMRRIAARRDPDAARSEVTEYTDWDRLYRFLDSWTEAFSVPSASVRSAG